MARRFRNITRIIRPRGVRTKLLLSFIGVVFFTTLILGLVTVNSARQLARENAVRGLKLVADIRAKHLEMEIERLLHLMDDMHLRKVRGKIQIDNVHGQFDSVVVLDSKGNTLASLPEDRGIDLLSPPIDDIRLEALKAEGALSMFVERGGGLGLLFARKIHSGRNGNKVLLGMVNIDAARWSELLGVSASDYEISTLVVDEKGSVRYYPRDGAPRFEHLQTESANGDGAAAPKEEAAGSKTILFALEAEKQLGVAREINHLPGWKLIAHQPYRNIYSQVARMTRRIELISLLALIVAIFIGLYRARRITRPLTELLKATEEIAEGEYSKRVSVHARDEIGLFAYAFNRMTTTLEENINELKQSRGNLEETYNQLKSETHKQQTTDRELHSKIQQMVSLNELTRTVTSTMELQDVMEKIADLIFRVMDFDACSIKLPDQKNEMLRVSIARGLGDEYLSKGSSKIGEGISSLAVESREPVIVSDVEADTRIPADHVIRKMGVRSLVSYPLITKDEVVGVLNLYTHYAREVSEDEKRLLDIFANQAASAIENARLFDSLRESYLNTIQALSMAIDAKDQYTHGHSKRVSDIAQIVGEQLGLSRREMEHLRHTGDLHDIGKIGISEMIISKAEKLTVEEYEIIKTHPLVGETIIEPVPFLQDIRKVIRHHHERWDGFGYPDGLKGEEIPLLARIILIADAYDAMTSDRPYRRALKHEEAIREIKKHSGTQFDPGVVEAFMAVMERRTPEEIMQKKAAREKEEAS
ncbi:MAG: HD domain-containing phosphohydrolase [bacterium]